MSENDPETKGRMGRWPRPEPDPPSDENIYSAIKELVNRLDNFFNGKIVFKIRLFDKFTLFTMRAEKDEPPKR